MTGDDHPAAASRVGSRSEVFGTEAGCFTGGEECRGIFVITDAADVENGGGGKDILRRGRVRWVSEGERWM